VVCYVVIHSYLNSAYVDNNELILKYRGYLIYLACADLLGVLALYYTSKPKKAKKKNSKRPVKRQLINDVISPDIQMKVQQEKEYDLIKLKDLQQRAESDKPKVKSDEDKNIELFVTQDEITTNSIPVYKSKRKDIDSIPVYQQTNTTNSSRGIKQ
jgi:hypothetical protein